MNNEIYQKIKLAQNVIDSDLASGFNKLYSFTTENIKGYINDFDFNNKSLLTVGSSADQAISAVLNGCKDLTIIDINPFVKYYFNLKKAAILVLDYNQFMNYFYNYGLNPMLFHKDIYIKLRELLWSIDADSLLFWDGLFKNNNSKVIRYRLFKDDIMENGSLRKFNPYLSSKYQFNTTKQKIINVNPKFINCNILDINKYLIDSKFDNIFLSNIYDYINEYDDLCNFKLTLNYLIKSMNVNGKLMIAYLYGVNKTNSLLEFVQHFNYEQCNIKLFQGIRATHLNDDTKDAIVTYQKTKKYD